MPVYQLKITLKDSRPPIWRRVQVSSDITLAKLHQIIQEVMGWYDCHLHEFRIEEVAYGVPDPDASYEVRNERKVKLGELLLKPKAKFRYSYDFGDGWEHEILVEDILEVDAKTRYPICLAGKRACPPEDVGGIYGYADFLEAIADPHHEQHEEMLEWIGEGFDPEAFDLDDINRSLKGIR